MHRSKGNGLGKDSPKGNKGSGIPDTFTEQTDTVERLMKTQIGTEITFKHRVQCGKHCQEFIVASPKFSIKRWFVLTVIFNVIGVLFELHTHDSRLMTVLLVLLIFLLILKLHFKVKQESLLVMGSIGIQLTTTFASGRSIDTFYDISRIRNVIINEGITMQRVMFYLTLLLREDCASSSFTRLVPLFQKTWPPLACLMVIRRGTKTVLGHSAQSTPQ